MNIDDKFRPLTTEDLQRSKIGARYWTVSLGSIPDEYAHKQKVGKWIEKIDQFIKNGVGIHLYGESGSGLTSLGCICAKAALSAGYTSLYMTSFALRRVVSEKPEFDDFSDMYTRVRTVDLLVIDDAERGQDNIWGKIALEEIIKSRLSHKKAFIFITKCNPTSIAAFFGVDIAGALKEACIPIECALINWRDKIAEDLKKQIE